MNRQSLQLLLEPFAQEHLLAFWDELDSQQQSQLDAQIRGIDFEELARLIAHEVEQVDFSKLAAVAEPPPSVAVDGSGAEWTVAQAKQRGDEALSRGEVGAIIVAGGQGTRLGFDQPKGMFPIGPVSNRTLFQMFADRLMAIRDRYQVSVPLYVMTSDATDQATRHYFESNEYFGLPPQDVQIFKQGTMPAVDANSGKVLLEAKGSIALSPDGHGGTVAALKRSGCLDDAQQRGIKHLSYIQVDNPLSALCDPVLIGHHLLAESEMTTHVVRKRDADERVGNVVFANGSVQIIEYSDLPEAAAQAKQPDGSLRLWAGNIAVHILDVGFLERMYDSADSLPFHRANKKVTCIDAAGTQVVPDAPNAIKFERFIFDMLPQANNAFVVEALPSEAFAPVKNADGAKSDTPELSRRAIHELHRKWLELAGAVVDEGVLVEINPRFSLSGEELREKIPANLRIDRDQYFDI